MPAWENDPIVADAQAQPAWANDPVVDESPAWMSDPVVEEPGERPGRIESAAGSFARAAGKGVSDVPKSVAIEHGEAQQYLLSRFDQIDSGQQPSGIQSPTVREYSSATPERRTQLRQEAKSKADPTKYPSFKLGRDIDKFIADKTSVDPAFEQEFWSGKVPAGLGSMVSYVVTGITGALGARSGRLPGALGSGGAVSMQATKQSSVAGFEDAIEKGASLEDAYSSSNMNELMGYSEAIPIARILDRVDKGTGGLIKRSIVNAGKAGTEEAIQEASQTIYENLVASDLVGYDPNRGMLTGAGEGAGVGFTTGSLVQFLGTVIGGRRAATPKTPEEKDAEAITRITSAPDVETAIDAAMASLDTASADELQAETDLDSQLATLETPELPPDQLTDSIYKSEVAQTATPAPASAQGISPTIAEVPGITGQDQRLDAQRADRGARRRLQKPDEFAGQAHREKMAKVAAKFGLSPEQADGVSGEIAPQVEIDEKIGYYKARDLMATIERADKHSQETGEPAFYVEADYANMGGGNKAKGSNEAFDQEFLIPATAMLRKEVESAGGDVVPGRVGGDEVGFVIVGVPEDKIRAVLNSAAEKTAQLARDQGIGDIENPKYPGSPERGINLYFGITPILKGKSAREVRMDADRQVNINKLERNERGNGSTIRTPGAGPSEGQAAGIESRTAEAVGRVSPVDQAAKGGEQREPRVDGSRDQSSSASSGLGAPNARGNGFGNQSEPELARSATRDKESQGRISGKPSKGQVDEQRDSVSKKPTSGASSVRRDATGATGVKPEAGRADDTKASASTDAQRARRQSAPDDLIADLESGKENESDDGKYTIGETAKGNRSSQEERDSANDDRRGAVLPVRQERQGDRHKAGDQVDSTKAPAQGASSLRKPKGPPRFFTAKQASDRGYISNVSEIEEFNKLIKAMHAAGREFNGETVAELREITKEKTNERVQEPETAEEVSTAAHQAATSPKNDLPEPTEAQRAAGNYRMGHINVGGLDVTIEVPKGGERKGKTKAGKEWSVTMPAHYGYIRKTEGADGEHIDVYVGDSDSNAVYVVDQVNAESGKFDEHKAMLNFESEAAARSAYEKAFNDGKGNDRIGAITPMSTEEFKTWAKEGDTKKPVGKLEKSKPLYSKTSIPKSAHLAEVGKFKTGKPVTFKFIHNKQSATKIFGKPKKDDRFFRGYEPSGRYVAESNFKPEGDQFIVGELTFQNPLVVDNRNGEWKKDLSDSYKGLSGKKLSKALIGDGYDGVVTVDMDKSGKPRNTSEILDLTTFDERIAKYSKQSVATGPRGPGMRPKSVQQIVDDFMKDVDADVRITVQPTQEAAGGKDMPDTVKAVFKGDELILIAENLNGKSDIESVLRHEIFAHYGFSLFPAETQATIEGRINETRDDPKYADTWQHVLKNYDDMSRSVQAQEFLAKLAETEKGRLTKLYYDVLAMIQTALRKLGWKGNITRSEIQALLNTAERMARRGGDVGEMEPVYQKVFHGTPHKFDKFSLDAMGTGEGNQAYGWGLYFAGKKEIAEFYRGAVSYVDVVRQFREEAPDDADMGEIDELIDSNGFSPKMNSLLKALRDDDWFGFGYPSQAITAAFKELNAYDPSPATRKAVQEYGNLYKAEIPEDSDLLDWNKPMKSQPEAVAKKLEEFDFGGDQVIAAWKKNGAWPNVSGETIYRKLAGGLTVGSAAEGKHKQASMTLNSIGIPGLRYLDNTKTGHNYVIWDENAVTVEAVNDELRQAEETRFSKTAPKGAVSVSGSAIFLKDEGDISKVKTGQPVTFNYLHNTESAAKHYGKPKAGDRFGRDLEPAGQYVNPVSEKRAKEHAAEFEGFETGVKSFKNPLVLSNDSLQWKGALSKQYGGKTGKALSKAIVADGYDGIITTEKNYISEVVDLSSFIETPKSGQTDTKAFRDWFGDSKVVDENGKPLVVYHGTINDFSTFENKKGYLYFADNPDVAGLFTKPALAKGGGNIRPVYLAIKKPLTIELPLESGDTVSKAQTRAKRNGHDGVIVENWSESGRPTTMYIAFGPEQIKSAIGNRGTFSPDDPNILYSKTKESEFSQENRRLREEHKTMWNKSKQYYRRNFMPGGLLPKDVFQEKIQRDSEIQVVEFDINHLVGSLENIVKSEYGAPFDKLDRQTMLKLNRALVGKVDADIKPKTLEAIVAMRQYIDSLSRDYVSILQEQQAEFEADGSPEAVARAGLIETITSNIGTYAHRSYKAFDDKDWFKKIPDSTLNAARKYFIDQYVELGETPADAKRMAEVTLNEIIKNGTAYSSMDAFIKESKLGAKDLTVLKKRKQIAPEIRALLGEYIDPRVNFAKSATKMGRLVWNQRFLDRVRDMGMGSFLFEGRDRPPEATIQIAADGSDVYAPLNGLWTYPEIDQAFKDALAKEKMADWYRVIVQLNGMVKYGKTVLSPTTAARNWQSAMFFALANGHFDMRHMAKSVAGLREYFTNGGDKARLEYLRNLKKLGVVYDTPYAGEMMRLLEESKIDDLMKSKSSTPYKAFRAMNKFATKAYQYGDDFWKIIGFENEKSALIDAGMTEAAAEKEAADRIRNTYPTYSMVGRAINWLRRFPLVGTFVSFPAEIIRTQGNILRYIHKDWTEGRKKLALKRAAGQAFAAGAIYGLAAVSKAMFGIDDEEEEAVRLMAAPWERNSNLLFTGRDESGQLQYIDLSFLDPYNYFKRPITAILRDQPWEDSAADVFVETLKPFLGTDIAAGAIFEAMANKKDTGTPVYNEFGTPLEITGQIGNHLRKALQPGIVSNLERTWKAMEGERSSSGRTYDLGDEAFGWAGWRFRTLEPKTALYYRSFEFADAKAEATKTLTQVLRDPNDVDDDDIRSAYRSAQRQQAEAYREMTLIINAAKKNGLADRDISAVLKASSVSDKDIALLIRGKIPPVQLSKQSLSNATKKARAVFDAEMAAEIQKRYKTANQLSRE